MKIKVWISAIFLLTTIVDARYISVKNEAQFIKEINEFEFALVSFLHSPSSNKEYYSKSMRQDIKNLKETIHATSDTDPYRNLLKHELGFIVLDPCKDAMEPIAQKYAVACHAMPQFLLFHQGKVVSSMSGELEKLVGFVCKADLLDFIDDHFGKQLDDILEQKADKKAADQEMQLARYAAYAAYRYPYGGYAPYNAYGPYSWYGYNSFYQNHGYWGHTFYVP